MAQGLSAQMELRPPPNIFFGERRVDARFGGAKRDDLPAPHRFAIPQGGRVLLPSRKSVTSARFCSSDGTSPSPTCFFRRAEAGRTFRRSETRRSSGSTSFLHPTGRASAPAEPQIRNERGVLRLRWNFALPQIFFSARGGWTHVSAERNATIFRLHIVSPSHREGECSCRAANS